MKKHFRPAIIFTIGLALAILSAALTSLSSAQTLKLDTTSGAALFFLQTTATPQPQDISKIGSTDGIIVMGFVIVLIVVIPILLRRKSWKQP